MSYNWDQSCKVYIGNLGNNGSLYEIKSIFAKYGKLRNAWIARNPPGFAFIEFEDSRDAKDAVRVLDGTYVSYICICILLIHDSESFIKFLVVFVEFMFVLKCPTTGQVVMDEIVVIMIIVAVEDTTIILYNIMIGTI